MSDCIFCKIIKGEIPSKKVYENEKVFAFEDISPQAPVHIVVIPKKHIESLNDVNEENADYIKEIMIALPKIAKDKSVDKAGYRVINNIGKDGGQTVNHIHFHLLGGRGLKWPPG